MLLRLIGKGVAGIGKERIPVTIAAAAGGHRLTLREGIKAAGSHRGSDVLTTILSRRRRRRHRDKGHREQRRGGRSGQFQKLFHVLSRWFCLFGFGAGFQHLNRHGMSGNCAPSTTKKSNAILLGARPKIEIRYAMAILKYDHHPMGRISVPRPPGRAGVRRGAPGGLILMQGGYARPTINSA